MCNNKRYIIIWLSACHVLFFVINIEQSLKLEHNSKKRFKNRVDTRRNNIDNYNKTFYIVFPWVFIVVIPQVIYTTYILGVYYT